MIRHQIVIIIVIIAIALWIAFWKRDKDNNGEDNSDEAN
jgi:hypothetical protein